MSKVMECQSTASLPPQSNAPESSAFHGGKSFEAIGEDFQHLERAESCISADVLDAWFDPSPRVIQKLQQYLPLLARTSPPVHSAGLLSAISRARGVKEDCILAAGGSSDLIFACLPHLIGPKARVMLLDPMYGEYQYFLTKVLGVEVVHFELEKENEFRIDTDAVIARVRAEQPELLVLVNPNSPTGQHWPRCELLRFLDSVPDATQIVIDETYIDYVGSFQSVEREAAQRPNVLVIKSMSKTYALSGLRVGYLVGHRSVIRGLSLWIPPWAVSLPAQVGAVEALNDPAYYETQYRKTHALRRQLTCELQRNALIRVYPSNANFLLIETQSSAQLIVERMRRANVFIRNCDSMGNRFCDRFLRIAVKKQEENRRIAQELDIADQAALT